MHEVSRKPQFHLSHALLLVLAIGIALAWWSDRRQMQLRLQIAEQQRQVAEKELLLAQETQVIERMAHEAALEAYQHLDDKHQQEELQVAHLQGTWRSQDPPGQLLIVLSSFRATDIPGLPGGTWLMEVGATKTLNFLRLVREHHDGFLETRCFLYRVHDDRLDLCFNKDDQQRYPVGFDTDDEKTRTLSFRRDPPLHEQLRETSQKRVVVSED